MSATRCRGTARASTGSSCAARRSCAGRCTATCCEALREGRLQVGPGVAARAGRVDHRAGQRRVRIGAGTFLNMGVMVAAQELVEIGDHCMLANGCFVSDASHRFDDPEKPITWQGFESKGPTRIGDNCWLGANVVVTSGVTHRRALRDRRQQRRHTRHRAVLDRRRRAREGAAGGSSTEPASVRSWTSSRRCAARRRAAASSPTRCRARRCVRALDAARFAPSGGNRQGWRVVVVEDPERRAALRDLYLPHWRAYTEHDGSRADAGRPRQLRSRRACGWCAAPTTTPSGLAEVPVHLVVGVRLADLAVTDAAAAAPEHRRRRLDVPVRAEPAARAARARASAPRSPRCWCRPRRRSGACWRSPRRSRSPRTSVSATAPTRGQRSWPAARARSSPSRSAGASRSRLG